MTRQCSIKGQFQFEDTFYFLFLFFLFILKLGTSQKYFSGLHDKSKPRQYKNWLKTWPDLKLLLFHDFFFKKQDREMTHANLKYVWALKSTIFKS